MKGRRKLRSDASRTRRISVTNTKEIVDALDVGLPMEVNVVNGDYSPTSEGTDDLVVAEEEEAEPSYKHELEHMAIQQNSFWAMFYAEFYHLFNYMIENNAFLFPESYGYSKYRSSYGIYLVKEPDITSEENKYGDIYDELLTSYHKITKKTADDQAKFLVMVQCIMSVLQAVEKATPCLVQPVGMQHRFFAMLRKLGKIMDIATDTICAKGTFLGQCNPRSTFQLLDLSGIPKCVSVALRGKKMNFVSYWIRIRTMLVNLRICYEHAMAITENFIEYQDKSPDLPNAQIMSKAEYVRLRKENIGMYGYMMRDLEAEEIDRGERNRFTSYVYFNYVPFVSQLCSRTDVGHQYYYPPIYSVYYSKALEINSESMEQLNFIFGESYYNLFRTWQVRMGAEFHFYRDTLPDRILARIDNTLITAPGPYSSIFVRLLLNVAGGKDIDVYKENWEEHFKDFNERYVNSSALHNPFHSIKLEGISDYHTVSPMYLNSFKSHWNGVVSDEISEEARFNLELSAYDYLKMRQLQQNKKTPVECLLETEQKDKKHTEMKKNRRKQKKNIKKQQEECKQVIAEAKEFIRALNAMVIQRWVRRRLLLPNKIKRNRIQKYSRVLKELEGKAYHFTERFRDQEYSIVFLSQFTGAINLRSLHSHVIRIAARTAFTFTERYRKQQETMRFWRRLFPVIFNRRAVLLKRKVLAQSQSEPCGEVFSRPGDPDYRFEYDRWITVRDMVRHQLELILVFNLRFDRILINHLMHFRGLVHYEFLMAHPCLKRLLWQNYHGCFHIQLLREAAKSSPLLRTTYEGIVKPEFFYH